jgi:hypothetical protein
VKPSQIFGLKINLTIPDDAMTQADTIEVENLPQLECGDSFGAYISVSNDPQDFFIQLKTTESVLQTTMNDLDEFYCDMESSTKYKIKRIEPGIIGLPCAALYCNKSTGKSEGWHRGIIVEIYDNESVEVYYVSTKHLLLKNEINVHAKIATLKVLVRKVLGYLISGVIHF